MKAKRFAALSTGRRRTADEIGAILEGHRKSGLSLLAFARKHELCYATLRRWRVARALPGDTPGGRPASQGQRRDVSAAAGFVPVQLDAEVPAGDFILAWSPGRLLRIPAGFDPGQLRRLLVILGVRP